MFKKQFCERLTALRIQKDVSARDMSLSLGQSAGYINKIENGKALPSMNGFSYICDYLGVTPRDFFDFSSPYPHELDELMCELKRLDADSLALVTKLIKRLK